jgi:hypothetical protein
MFDIQQTENSASPHQRYSTIIDQYFTCPKVFEFEADMVHSIPLAWDPGVGRDAATPTV